METLIFSLIGTVLTGLTFFAYKHPIAFKPICNLLNALGLAIYLGIAIWNFALNEGFFKITQFLIKDEDTYASAEVAIETLKVPMGTAFLVLIAFISYLLFLSFLPRLLENEKKTI